MTEWSFQRKLISGVIVVGLLAVLTSAASLFTARVLISNMAQVATGETRELADARTLQLLGAENTADVNACLLTGGADGALGAREGSVRIRELATRMQAQTTDAETRGLLGDVLASEHARQDAFAHALGAYGPARAHAAPTHFDVVLSRSEQFDQALAALATHVNVTTMASLGRSRDAVHRSETLLLAIIAGTVLLLVVLCLLLIGALSRSYRQQMAARTLAEHGQSEARASLTEVEAASQLKDEFLATVSHELRNPLAPILTWTQLLRSGTLDEAKTRRALEVIERNVLSQAQLIDDLVDVSRVVSGKFRLDVRPVDLGPVIKAVADSQAPAVDAKMIKLQLVLDERAGLVSGDSERLQQVMWNLISNAIKFTPKGGRVQVILQRAESHVEVSVSDSGVGIEPELLPHVFEPFRQGTGGSMRRHGGLGLGLSIVRHIVELHGGEINAFSDGAGLGARFTIKLPLLATARVNGEPARRHPIARDTLSTVHLRRLDGIRVLLVEDEPSASEALMVLFKACGADARAAGSAAEALVVFATWQPDVLVSDIAMPGEDGYSLIRKIRQRSPLEGGAVPAVALTAYAKIEDRVTILAAGFQMYLSKPADPNELIAVVGSLARRREAGEAPVPTL